MDDGPCGLESGATASVALAPSAARTALFVVWQQGRQETETFGDYRFGRDFRGVFGIPANNVFLVKLSYWLNY